MLLGRQATNHPTISHSAVGSTLAGIHNMDTASERIHSPPPTQCLSSTPVTNICTPVATLPGAWRYRVSAGTGRPGVSIL